MTVGHMDVPARAPGESNPSFFPSLAVRSGPVRVGCAGGYEGFPLCGRLAFYFATQRSWFTRCRAADGKYLATSTRVEEILVVGGGPIFLVKLGECFV